MQTVKWPKLTWKKATVALIPSIGNETSALVCCGCWNAHFPALDKSLCGRNHKNIWFWISEFQIQLSPLFFPDMRRHSHWASQCLYSKNLNWIFRFFLPHSVWSNRYFKIKESLELNASLRVQETSNINNLFSLFGLLLPQHKKKAKRD